VQFGEESQFVFVQMGNSDFFFGGMSGVSSIASQRVSEDVVRVKSAALLRGAVRRRAKLVTLTSIGGVCDR